MRYIAVKGNTIADDPPRLSIEAAGGDPFPGRELRPKFRAMLVGHCVSMDGDMMSGDKGLNAGCGRFQSPAQ